MMDTGVLCKFVNRPTNGEKRIFIAPIYFKHVDKCGPTFSFKRRQLRLRLCYVMSINKAQGQTLDKLGLLLTSPVFSHENSFKYLLFLDMYQCKKVMNRCEDYLRSASPKDISPVEKLQFVNQFLLLAGGKREGGFC
ncbi:hypothetical protein QR680_008055 [Steinernema hermaphroditum]|uniref:ATP-dependent DNA helicase n=1 Tax=Steinernema hermaphroditum TaxID=289476 RepID=A0AA39IF64_9BILA|nr:hypothetical protein QR680_008055 [Steinernema hermaphroditum]